jgi:membrane-anchored protein YejM (alkaline phosphatase superfamily)
MSRGALFRWAGWFALVNSLVFGLVSLRYFSGGVPIVTPLAMVYVVTVYIGHHVLLTFVPLFLLATPLILIYPSRKVLTVLAVVLFSVMIALMLLDSLLWSQSRFHLNALTSKILGWQSWAFAGFMFLVALFFQSMLAKGVWSWVSQPKKRPGRSLAAICVLSIVISQGIHAWADANYYVPVTGLGQVLPVYKGVTAKQILTRHGWVDIKASREREMARRMSGGMDKSFGRLLDYPLRPLQCSPKREMNLLFIIVDSLRGSILTEEFAPKISRFAARDGITFRNHYSGGNSSRMGMFSLFYGLPPGYWETFSSLQRAPVLLDELQSREYQLGLFSSATMYRPVVLDRTAFANVPDLRNQSEPASDAPWKRDRTATREWFDWLDARDEKRPFFGFLFYDTVMTQNPPPDYSPRWPPPDDSEIQADLARYRQAVHYADGLVGEVLDDLQGRGLLDNTVVLISSDHGEEFGESAEKLDGHGSGFTREQLVVPMVLAWPGREGGQVIDYRTSHYDVAPTLMQSFFGCSNDPSDYSVGRSLFDGEPWTWMVAGSYFNFAILEPDQVIVTFPNGLYEVRDWEYRLLPEPVLRGKVLESVSEQNARFFRD